MVATHPKKVGSEAFSNTIQEAFKKSKQCITLEMNDRNGDDVLLGKMPNVIEEDVTTNDEMESIRRKRYGFVGKWNELSIYEKIAEIID